MKPVEAVTKWCPFSRGIFIDMNIAGQGAEAVPQLKLGANSMVGDFNRYLVQNGNFVTAPPQGCNCLAGGCAAWRWDVDEKTLKSLPTGEEADGHCGLAHVPRGMG